MYRRYIGDIESDYSMKYHDMNLVTSTFNPLEKSPRQENSFS